MSKSAKAVVGDDSDNEFDEVEDAVVYEPEPEPEENTTLANSEVVTKYQEAARIANSVLRELILTIVPGISVLDVCKIGDRLIEEKLALVYRGKGKSGKQVDKGIAFPVCVSVNEVVCHYSPLDSDIAVPIIAENDHVKIDLGVHIDGYIAVVAHTIIITPLSSIPPSPTPSSPVITGICADVYNAAYAAAEIATKLIRPNNTNQQVTEAILQIARTYNVNAISGTVMHQLKRYVIDGNKKIMVTSDPIERKAEKVDLVTFEVNEVYAVDVAFSSGEGKPKDKGSRTTVFKRNIDRKYGLKVKASRSFFNEVNKRFPTFPFSLRYISDEKNARLGLRECVQHELLGAYPILVENKGDVIAHFKFTVLVLPSRTAKITGLELPMGLFQSEGKDLPEELKELLVVSDGSASAAAKKKNKKKKKKVSAAAATATEGDEDEDDGEE